MTINATATTKPGDQIFFTVLSQTADVQPSVVGSPTINGQTISNIVNVRYPDVALHTFNQSLNETPDPWSDGYHNWYVGDFNGNNAFNESLLTFPSFAANGVSRTIPSSVFR